MDMVDYSGDLCDHFGEVIKRFNDGLNGTVQYGKMLSVVSDNHKKSVKGRSKIKLNTEANMGFGVVMKDLMTYVEMANKEEEEFANGIGEIRTDIQTKEKELRKNLQIHQKNESKVAKKLAVASAKAQSCKKKDQTDSLKWRGARKVLTDVIESKEPIKKLVSKNLKVEKKLRNNAIKSRDAYEKSVEEWAEKNEEYHDSTAEILGEMEQMDMKFMEDKKKAISDTLEQIEKYHQKMTEMTKKIRLEIAEKMKPEQFINDFLEKASTFPSSEEISFEPQVIEKEIYNKTHPDKSDLQGYLTEHPFVCQFPVRGKEIQIKGLDLSVISYEIEQWMKDIPKSITYYLDEGAEHWHSNLDLRECSGFTAESINEDRKIVEGRWVHSAFPRSKSKSKFCHHFDWNLKADEEGNVKGGSSTYFDEKQNEMKNEMKGRFISKRVVYSENVVRTNISTGAQSNSRMLMCFGNEGVVRVFRFAYDGGDNIIESFFAERWFVKAPLDEKIAVPGQIDTCDVYVDKN